jgi:hypothetical protein
VNAEGKFELDHTYALPGTYFVAVQGNDDDGRTSTTSISVRVTFDPHTWNRHYVDNLYHSMLNRSGDENGLEFFAGLLDQGGSRNQVARELLASAEYKVNLIKDVYQSYLQREVETDALNYWLQALAQGLSEQQFRAKILGSEDYFRQAGATDSSFLLNLYRDSLGRALDAKGEEFIGPLLARGFSREHAALQVLTSAEARENRIVGWYDQFLQRQADVSGLDYFFQLLSSGTPEPTALEMLLASNEYAART